VWPWIVLAVVILIGGVLHPAPAINRVLRLPRTRCDRSCSTSVGSRFRRTTAFLVLGACSSRSACSPRAPPQRARGDPRIWQLRRGRCSAGRSSRGSRSRGGTSRGRPIHRSVGCGCTEARPCSRARRPTRALVAKRVVGIRWSHGDLFAPAVCLGLAVADRVLPHRADRTTTRCRGGSRVDPEVAERSRTVRSARSACRCTRRSCTRSRSSWDCSSAARLRPRSRAGEPVQDLPARVRGSRFFVEIRAGTSVRARLVGVQCSSCALPLLSRYFAAAAQTRVPPPSAGR